MKHPPTIPADTYSQRVLDLASQKGLLRASDLKAIDAPRVVLTRLVAAGLLDRLGRGLYRLPGHPVSEHESLVVVAAKAPQAVFCLLTALQFHGLTTQLQRQIWIAMPRGSHAPRIDWPPTGSPHGVRNPQTKTPDRERLGAEYWWSGGGSNSRPSHCERDALPAELPPQWAAL